MGPAPHHKLSPTGDEFSNSGCLISENQAWMVSQSNGHMAMQALKNVMTQLSDVGETASIVPVVYSYLEILDGPSAASGRAVEMTLASQESAAEVDNKKAMLRAFRASPFVGRKHVCMYVLRRSAVRIAYAGRSCTVPY